MAAAYRRIFSRLGVPYTVVEGDGGSMGGVSSHEIHFPAGIGQDTLLLCTGAPGPWRIAHPLARVQCRV